MLYPRSTTRFASRAAWGPGGRFLAWSDRPRGEVVIEDMEGKTGRRVLSGITNLRGLAVSPNGRWLATCPLLGQAIEVRDLENEQVVWSQKGDYGRALFSPEGRRLATTMADKVSFWEVGSWRLLNEASCKAAGTMTFSPNGSLLAVNSADGIVMLMNPTTGETLARLQNPDPRIDPFHLAFSSDGTLLAMANGRRGVQVWDLIQVRKTLRVMGLDWDWTLPTRGDGPAVPVLGAMETHDPKAGTTIAEHAGEWSRAIAMRTDWDLSDPARLHRRGHCFAQLGRWGRLWPTSSKSPGAGRVNPWPCGLPGRSPSVWR